MVGKKAERLSWSKKMESKLATDHEPGGAQGDQMCIKQTHNTVLRSVESQGSGRAARLISASSAKFSCLTL